MGQMQAVLETPYDLDKIRAVLEGFRNLPTPKWRQAYGCLYTHNMSGQHHTECGACVGAWAAHFLGLPLREGSSLHDAKRVVFWDFEDGQAALAELLNLERYELNALLQDNGATDDPFGGKMWEVNPYDVLRATVLEAIDYDHDEYLRSLPVPLKEVENHEVLEVMP